MPRKNNAHIRRITLRLDISKPGDSLIYQQYASLSEKGDGSRWLRDALAKAVYGDSTQHARVTAPDTVTPPAAPMPPGYGPRQKTSVFQRPIPAHIGRKTE